MEKIIQENKNIVVKLVIDNLLKMPALNKNLIILNIHVVLKKSVFYEPLAQEINSKFNFKRLRTNINIIIDALYMYFSGSSSTRAISQYLLHRKNFKISHVAIYKWIKNFGALFKEISENYMPKNLNSSDEWHVDETVIKISGRNCN
ncbi:hypothetical protein [uncultured Fusobacterium sp.]|uniref:hypothetical protein n=1 Tax=uncultured Fusobacterium sp. TaxID=159267 RepID=UPI00260326BD|nr:hypothetical protein [uncultured Fusobacterium sp.]